jgi:hypothetical protein
MIGENSRGPLRGGFAAEKTAERVFAGETPRGFVIEVQIQHRQRNRF